MNKEEIIKEALDFALFNFSEFEERTNFKTYYEEVEKVLKYMTKKEELEKLKKELA